MPIQLDQNMARAKAREVHFGKYDTPEKAPGAHAADAVVRDTLQQALTSVGSATRAGRSNAVNARQYWNPQHEANDQLAQIATDYTNDLEEEEVGLGQITDQYTADRVNNMKSEVLSRFVQDLIIPQTTVVNNFFRTVQADAGETLAQLREFVTYVETISDWTYHRIDPQRGDFRPIDVNISQYSERVNTYMQMYGAMVEYENYLYRVIENVSVAEIFAMLTVGWAKASALQREYDASQFLTKQLDPATAFDNNGGDSALGQLSGVAANGKFNGTFDMDYDFPRLLDYMQGELNMSTDNLIMLLPRNAWSFMNMRKGYRRLLGEDGEPLYQRPDIQQGPRPAMWDDEKYGIRNQQVGFQTPSAAANYIQGSREARAANASEQMAPGPYPYLPTNMPNWMNVYMLPNSAFGPMRVVLTPFAQSTHKFYAADHPLAKDDQTGRPRPVPTTDMLLFDGNHPLYLVETVPPTSWTATEELHRKSTVVMVEGYAMANAVRGQQAVEINGAVLDHNWTHDLELDAAKVEWNTDHPLAGGLSDEAPGA